MERLYNNRNLYNHPNHQGRARVRMQEGRVKTYNIYIDERPYMGEDPNNTYSGGDCHSNQSFHTHRVTLNKLLIGNKSDTPKVIYGTRGIKNELERIIRRVDDGLIDVNKIVVLKGVDEK